MVDLVPARYGKAALVAAGEGGLFRQGMLRCGTVRLARMKGVMQLELLSIGIRDGLKDV